MFNNYWRRPGKAESHKGLNWIFWNNMSVPKSKGGLGFQNLFGFNITLLGKHIWNFMQNSNSFMTRVFKVKYFPMTRVLKKKRK